ncbi:MAG: bifunctional (p)ppGpp synthetase/guanosine-3',5'-bis(diphosphate) 3'-pyrophosphohydrolase [Defluviitaleaceae bacterium]|nr:bifunctional (p)ppGpp synthetase/guanosine-3',5'-bis(diphosphate) 3'-pyrophosphohydrolase [Defluviitaleaceae bacterium]
MFDEIALMTSGGIVNDDLDHTNYTPDTDGLFAELMDKMQTYHPSSDFTLVQRAYHLAKEAHQGQVRKSGEPYIVHPLMVAHILADLELDRETIAAGILHDIIEDTDFDYYYLRDEFSPEVANLVDGVTKLGIYAAKKSDVSSAEEEQAENYRKMFLAMANDIRVIIIKIADRLHNLRTLKFMTPEKQKSIAQESLDIYAPLAGRLGISALRREMEDLSFRYSNSEAYYDLKEKISMKRGERLQYVEDIERDIHDVLAEHGIVAKVEGRPKHFFSIYKKMKNQDKTIDQIFDLFAVRIIVDSYDKNQCYSALGAVHSIFTPIPERLKDYIATPKTNDYQSLHNSLIGPGGEPFEVQIRTTDMHKIAEYGIAAHWKYKEGIGGMDSSEVKLNWLREILEWHRDTPDNQEFLEDLKGDLDVYTEHVHCFTPTGEVKILVKGSTCIDFAYAIHSAVGNRMIGAKVNHEMKPKEYVLKNGEQVEILTSQNAKGPTSDWLKIAKSSQARNKIKQWLKKENREESIAKGKDMLEKAAKRKSNISLAKLLTPDAEKMILARLGYRDVDTMYASVGRGAVRENSIVNRLYDEYLLQNPEIPDPQAIIDEVNKAGAKKQEQRSTDPTGDVIIRGQSNLAVRFSKCCGPVPGDEIIGFITRGRGVSIHRTDCVNIINLPPDEAKRLIEAEWNTHEKSQQNFYVELNIICDNINLIAHVTQVLGKMAVAIVGLNARQTNGETLLTAAVSVCDRDELERVAAKLMSLKGVHQVDRIMT